MTRRTIAITAGTPSAIGIPKAKGHVALRGTSRLCPRLFSPRARARAEGVIPPRVPGLSASEPPPAGCPRRREQRAGMVRPASATPTFPASDDNGGAGDSAAPGNSEGKNAKSAMPRLGKSHMVDKFFQRLLWSSRTFVLAAVLGSLVMSGLMFLQGVAGVAECFHSVYAHVLAGHFTIEEPDVALACVEILDKFLAGIVTLIFGIGVYELFINEIDMGEQKNGEKRTDRPTWLHIGGIEDLEMRLGKVVITILVVNLLAAAKKIAITQAVHLVYIAAALFLAAGALTVLHWADSH
eukprot:jgi/Tetstr1/427170/TSEL_017358.t1